jgi:putative flippase GtrA
VSDETLNRQFDERAVRREFLRYGIASGVAFVVDAGALILLTELSILPYLASAAVGFILGLITNYLLCISWVFSARNMSSRRAEFMVFTLIGAVGLLLTETILYLGTDAMGFDYRLSKLSAVAVVFLWNFALRKLLLFRKSHLLEGVAL